MTMTIKNEEEIRRMDEAGQVVALIHARIQAAISPGVSTAELDTIARDTLEESGAVSSFLGYHGFPAHICASVNEEIVHGIPGNRRLRDGDIISVDVGAILAGYHGDSAWTYAVGQISADAAALMRDTEEALYLAVDAAVSGNRLGAIGHAVESHARRMGRGVVRNYGGHGIGRQMHEDPHVPNVGRPDRGVALRPGLTLAIEPMLTLGSEDTATLADGWTVVTADGSLAAHFEHTVAVEADGSRVLTRRLAPVLE
ncbi:MAG TPA: type I methionyl aminopeptidase [Thermomicrobiales bacterium]|nr:type I methionyl aminopeptidase [Thermomicrobiales bacterium]